MDTRKNTFVASLIAFPALVALAIFLMVPHKTEALITYPASAGLGIGSVRSSHILNGTLMGEDLNQSTNFIFGSSTVATTTAFAPLGIWSRATTTADIFVIANSASSTVFVVNNNGRTGVGTSTPGGLLGVQGRIVASGDISGANIRASGTVIATGNLSTAGTLTVSAPTTTFNGVALGWPTAAGAASTFLRTTTGGVLSWAANVTTSSGYFEQGETVNGATTIAHGLGAVPSRVSFRSVTTICNGADTAQFFTESNGAATGTLRAMTYSNLFDGTTDGNSIDASTTAVIFHETDGDSDRHAAYLSTLDSTNIILTFYGMTDDCNALQTGGQPLQIWWTAEA